ncbi:MAG: class I SAM-dependent methyltransferase [Chloroflexota bacterium]|jgi:magnesium-protoporphyrin O-methyltransferase
MDCCHCQAIEERFNRKRAADRLRDYQKDGLKRESQLLVDALVEQGIDGYSLLDVGGGMGALTIELIKRGIKQATINEASTAYLETAASEAQRQGLADQIEFIHGNIVTTATKIPSADVVTLDKVVCCYDDMPGLVRATLGKAGRLYGLVYPRDNLLVKAGFRYENLVSWLRGSDFRVFVYPTRAVDGLIRQNGFQMRARRTRGQWQIVVYGRAKSA